jgi:hypothetical protein
VSSETVVKAGESWVAQGGGGIKVLLRIYCLCHIHLHDNLPRLPGIPVDDSSCSDSTYFLTSLSTKQSINHTLWTVGTSLCETHRVEWSDTNLVILLS